MGNPNNDAPDGEDRMARIIGAVLAVPGVGILAFGVWLWLEMREGGVYSYRALLCCGVIGGGLTVVGIRQLLRGREEPK